MRKIHCLGLLALAFAFDAAAQATPCPGLPMGSKLQWDQKTGDGFTLCRAMDGEHQVLSLMLTDAPVAKLPRRNREEEGRIGIHEVHWYLPELAQGAERKRITVIELDENRYAQVWVDARNDAELQQLLVLAEGIALY